MLLVMMKYFSFALVFIAVCLNYDHDVNESLLMMIMMMMFTMTMMIITIFLLPQMSLLFVAVFPCLSALRQTRQPKENIWRKHRPQKNIAGKKNIAAEKNCRRKKKLPAKKTLPAQKKHWPQEKFPKNKNIAGMCILHIYTPICKYMTGVLVHSTPYPCQNRVNSRYEMNQ